MQVTSLINHSAIWTNCLYALICSHTVIR